MLSRPEERKNPLDSRDQTDLFEAIPIGPGETSAYELCTLNCFAVEVPQA